MTHIQMLSSNEFIHLPYTRDLTEGGIAYALQSLPSMFLRAGKSPYDKLRRVVANTAVELAFRRYLSEQGIPFDVKSVLPFTDSARYDVILGGRRCDIKSFFISYRDQIAKIKQNPEILLETPALVASEQSKMEGFSGRDIYLFAFMSGLVAASQDDLQKAIYKKQPYHLIHVMPEAWMRPVHWSPLGKLVLKSESAEAQVIEIHGQVEGRERRSLSVELKPNMKVEIEAGFFSVAYIQSMSLPNARIGIHSSARKETHLIGTLDWGNIWVYGLDIWLAGWLTRDEFHQQAKTLPEGSKVFQYEKTRAKNLYVPIHVLKPVNDLMKRVKDWSK